MRLNDLQNNEIVLIDANIIIYALSGKSEQCIHLIRRIAAGDVTGVIGAPAVAEVAHRLMVAEARENGWISEANPTKQLSKNPERVKRLFRYEQAITSLLATGIRFEPVEKEDFIAAMKIGRQYGLLTNDALLLAVGERLRIQAIATADTAFAPVRGVVMYSPDDLGKF